MRGEQPAGLAGAPADRPVGARAVRVSLVGADLGAVPPIVVEPAPVRTVGPDDPRRLVDGVPIAAHLDLLGPERAILRETPDGPAHRLLLPDPPAVGDGSRPGHQRREVIIDGWRIEVEVESAARAALLDRARRGRETAGRSGPTQVHAIIPGVVVSVSVVPGDAVTAGQQLLVVEAMKMQNELRSPRDGTIERVAVGAGATIDVGDLLLVLA